MKLRILTILLFAVLLVPRPAQANIIYVDAAATGSGTGVGWSDAYTTLRAALDVANTHTSTDSIFIAQGTYYPPGVSDNAAVDSAFGIYRGGIRLYGGFPAGGGARNPGLYPTVLDGAIGTTGRSCHVMVITGIANTADSIIVDGLTIQHGATSATLGGLFHTYNFNQVPRSFGGGIAIFKCANDAKTLISNCSIVNNSVCAAVSIFGPPAPCWGGGISINFSSPLIVNCIFAGNSGNTLTYQDPNTGQPVTVTSRGIALATLNGSPQVINTTFYGNTAGLGTIDNLGSTSGTVTANPALANCIIYGNSSNTDILNSNANSTATLTYSITEHGYNGIGNSTADPLFVNAAGGDFRLQPGSPAIDSGSNAAVPSFLSTDIAGDARIYNNQVDMGAYEADSTNIISGPTVTCIGHSASYLAYPTGGTFSVTNTSLAGISNSGVFTPLATGTDTVIYTQGGQSVYQPVIILSGPIAGSINPVASVCSGDSVFFTATMLGGTWYSSSNAVVVNGTTGHAKAITADTTLIRYVVSNAGGCSDTAQLTYVVLQKPDAGTVMPIPSRCAGDSILLVGSTTGGTWISDKPAKLAVNSTSGEAYALAADTVIVYHIFSNSNGCSDTAETSFVIYPLPVAAPIDSITGCAGSSVAFSAPDSGLWYSNDPAKLLIDTFGIGTCLIAGTVQVCHVVSNPGGCTDTAKLDFIIHPQPAPAVVVNNGILAATASFGSYQWMRNDTAIAGAVDSLFVLVINGAYTLAVTNGWGCTGTSPAIVISSLAIGNTPSLNGIKLYPNPVSNVLHIDAPNKVQVAVSRMDGVVIMSGFDVQSIDMSSWPMGIYHIIIRNAAGTLLCSRQITKITR